MNVLDSSILSDDETNHSEDTDFCPDYDISLTEDEDKEKEEIPSK